MKVLQVSPIDVPVTKSLRQAGTQRVILLLDRELTKLGVRSIVACSDGSHVAGARSPWMQPSLGLGSCYASHPKDYETYFAKVLSLAIEEGAELLHDHTSWLVLSEACHRSKSLLKSPILVTLHGALDADHNREYAEIWGESDGVYFCAISHSQKTLYSPLIRISGVIYNGIEVSEFPFEPRQRKKNYLFSLARIDHRKGQKIAIQIAKRSGLKLFLSGPVYEANYFREILPMIDLVTDISAYPVKRGYFQRVMQPLVENAAQIVYIGELDEEQKKQWYRYCAGFLMPIQWDEPFGLTMIEAMACGTPVIAFNRGSIPEIVEHGKTGFVVDTVDEMVEAVKHLDLLDAQECRFRVMRYFDSSKMAKTYLELYQNIIDSFKSTPSVNWPG
ncbi:D-inositol-3-phosphate glycosyltransferase [subsurface metagenome]